MRSDRLYRGGGKRAGRGQARAGGTRDAVARNFPVASRHLNIEGRDRTRGRVLGAGSGMRSRGVVVAAVLSSALVSGGWLIEHDGAAARATRPERGRAPVRRGPGARAPRLRRHALRLAAVPQGGDGRDRRAPRSALRLPRPTPTQSARREHERPLRRRRHPDGRARQRDHRGRHAARRRPPSRRASRRATASWRSTASRHAVSRRKKR